MTQPPHEPYQPPPVVAGYPTQPPPGDWTPPTAKKKRGPLPWLIGGLVVLVLIVGGLIAALMGGSGTPTASPSAPPLPQDRCGGGICQTEAAEQVATQTPDAAYTPKVKDFKLTAKITSKHCFGSAGCNVEFEPDLSYEGSALLDEDVTWRLTYEATGIEDGPLIGTVEVTGPNYESNGELVETKSTKSKITLKITSLEKLGI